MNSRIREVLREIENEGLRDKIVEIVENPQIEIGGTVHTWLVPLESSPGSLYRHHSYPGGIIQHIVATAKIAQSLCNVVEEIYGGEVDRDVVLAGALLHDIFKPLTYERAGGGIRTSKLGERMDHLTLIAAELIRRGFSLDLIHVVCSHHGGKAGPIWPRTVEALICHLADQVDSQLNGQILRAAKHLVRVATGEEPTLTAKDAFRIINTKATEGWEGITRALKELKDGD